MDRYCQEGATQVLNNSAAARTFLLNSLYSGSSCEAREMNLRDRLRVAIENLSILDRDLLRFPVKCDFLMSKDIDPNYAGEVSLHMEMRGDDAL
jgi:hypothetical protein